jgi:hypothetical protein
VHEIAKIIGSAKAKKDLFPVMNQLLLLDNSSKGTPPPSPPDAKVKRGAIKNRAKFYQALDETTREEFVDVFLQVQVPPLPSFLDRKQVQLANPRGDRGANGRALVDFHARNDLQGDYADLFPDVPRYGVDCEEEGRVCRV